MKKNRSRAETLRLQPENGCVTLRLESDVVSLVIQP